VKLKEEKFTHKRCIYLVLMLQFTNTIKSLKCIVPRSVRNIPTFISLRSESFLLGVFWLGRCLTSKTICMCVCMYNSMEQSPSGEDNDHSASQKILSLFRQFRGPV